MITAFINGCFDLLHVGHIRLFQYAKRQAWILAETAERGAADITRPKLVVAINSDSSMRTIKREPIHNQDHRKEILESIRYIDEVLIFDELTPRRLIAGLRPSFIVKGPDYAGKNLPEYDGIYVKIYPGHKEESSSEIIERIKERFRNDYDLR